jgi:hypothetical protein
MQRAPQRERYLICLLRETIVMFMPARANSQSVPVAMNETSRLSKKRWRTWSMLIAAAGKAR